MTVKFKPPVLPTIILSLTLMTPSATVVCLQSSLSLMAHTKSTMIVLEKLFNINTGCEQRGIATNHTLHTNPNANIKKCNVCPCSDF